MPKPNDYSSLLVGTSRHLCPGPCITDPQITYKVLLVLIHLLGFCTMTLAIGPGSRIYRQRCLWPVHHPRGVNQVIQRKLGRRPHVRGNQKDSWPCACLFSCHNFNLSTSSYVSDCGETTRPKSDSAEQLAVLSSWPTSESRICQTVGVMLRRTPSFVCKCECDRNRTAQERVRCGRRIEYRNSTVENQACTSDLDA